MATINELQDEVVEEFQDFSDWMDKYQMLIDLGNELAPLDEKYKNEQNLIDGCQSSRADQLCFFAAHHIVVIVMRDT